MTRRAARITHDELRRMIKAATESGLPIARIVFNGQDLSLVIGGDSGEVSPAEHGHDGKVVPLLREPKL